jgi:hypothetical protein
MAYPKRQDSFEDDTGVSKARPPGPILVEDERTPQTAPDSAGSKPPRVPPGVRATDFAPTPDPDPVPLFVPKLEGLLRPLRYFSFRTSLMATVIIVVYLVVLLLSVFIMTQLPS